MKMVGLPVVVCLMWYLARLPWAADGVCYDPWCGRQSFKCTESRTSPDDLKMLLLSPYSSDDKTTGDVSMLPKDSRLLVVVGAA